LFSRRTNAVVCLERQVFKMTWYIFEYQMQFLIVKIKSLSSVFNDNQTRLKIEEGQKMKVCTQRFAYILQVMMSYREKNQNVLVC